MILTSCDSYSVKTPLENNCYECLEIYIKKLYSDCEWLPETSQEGENKEGEVHLKVYLLGYYNWINLKIKWFLSTLDLFLTELQLEENLTIIYDKIWKLFYMSINLAVSYDYLLQTRI